MQCYRIIEITNQEPLKIGAGGSKANQTEPSKDCIPGSTLRGAIIGQLVRHKTFEQDKQRILLQMACYNAYPYRNNSLYLPAPRHLRVDKHEWRAKKADYDSKAQVELIDLLTSDGEARKAKNTLPYRFLAIKGAYLAGLNVEQEYRLHHTTSKNIDKTEKENLFRYQAMAAGQVYRAVIRFDPGLQPLLEPVFQQETEVYLGGSKGSGYGLCQWRPIGPVLTDYQEVKSLLGLPVGLGTQFNGQTGQELRIICLSDVLIRNEYGQPVNYIPESYIETISGQAVRLDRQFVQTGITEGYNTTWQARYPKETTLRAGSVLRYTFQEKALNERELQKIAEKLESWLLGGRIQDGFGWLGVNLPYPQTLRVEEEQQGSRQQYKKTAKSEADQILADLRGDETARQVLSVLVSGLEGSKERWLKIICLKLWAEDRPQEPGEDSFVISTKLKKAQLRQMQSLLKKYLENLNISASVVSLPDFPERSYQNDNCLFSIAKCNFTQIMAYLRTDEDYPALTAYAWKMLKTQKGTLFYSDAKQPEKQFIAELLNTGLSIRIGGRKNE